jgi:microtubule-associated protein-like 6
LPNHTDAPEENLVLEHAHGFRSFDTRGNLAFTSEDKIIWTTAGVGVVSDNDLNQSFFNQHHEDIVSMALHPDGDIVATGQMAAKGVTAWNKGKNKEGKLVNMMIWKASTQELISEIHGFHRRAIRHLEFSKNGTKLLSVGEDDYNSVAVYDWTNKTILASSKVDGGKIYGAAWKDDNEFTLVGAKVIVTFTLSGGNLNKVKRPFI